jgi:hypothetical protein
METPVELHDTSDRAAQAVPTASPKLSTLQVRDRAQDPKGSLLQGMRPRGDSRRSARTSTVHLSDQLAQQIQRFAAQLKIDYGSELQYRLPAADAGKLFMRLLRPRRKRGRPRSPMITAAIELAKQGLPLAQIAWRVIPDFGNLCPLEQSYHRDQLRRAMHMRRSTVIN